MEGLATWLIVGWKINFKSNNIITLWYSCLKGSCINGLNNPAVCLQNNPAVYRNRLNSRAALEDNFQGGGARLLTNYWKEEESSCQKQWRLCRARHSPGYNARSKKYMPLRQHRLLVKESNRSRNLWKAGWELQLSRDDATCDCSSHDTIKFLSNWWHWNHSVLSFSHDL